MPKRARRKASGASGIVEPPPERAQHSEIEAIERPIADAQGAIGRLLRTIDIVAALHRRGAITGEMRQAADDFRSAFKRAGLEVLRAQNLMRVARGKRADDIGILAAKQRVWRALQACVGVSSAAGACAWHVLGGEMSLKDWALSQGWSGRLVTQENATGILIAALGILAQHFGYAPRGASRF